MRSAIFGDLLKRCDFIIYKDNEHTNIEKS